MKHLVLNQNNILIQGLQTILSYEGKCKTLKQIDVEDCGIILFSGGDVEMIKKSVSKNCYLQELKLENNGVDPDLKNYIK